MFSLKLDITDWNQKKKNKYLDSNASSQFCNYRNEIVTTNIEKNSE